MFFRLSRPHKQEIHQTYRILFHAQGKHVAYSRWLFASISFHEAFLSVRYNGKRHTVYHILDRNVAIS